jgi:hypothetical protein
VSNHIYAVVSKIKPATQKCLPILMKYVASEKIDSEAKITGNIFLCVCVCKSSNK